MNLKYVYTGSYEKKKQLNGYRDKYTFKKRVTFFKESEYSIESSYDEKGKELKGSKILTYILNEKETKLKIYNKDFEINEDGSIKIHRYRKTKSSFEANKTHSKDSEVM